LPWSTIAPLILLAAAAMQMAWVTLDFAAPRTRQYAAVRDRPAWERSAVLSEGTDFAEFVAFLRTNIPESAKVVLPPHSDIGQAGAYTYVSFMQYFFFPRHVLNCGEDVAECVRGLSGPSSYLVRIGPFPPADLASEHKTYVPFRDDLGLYAPK